MIAPNLSYLPSLMFSSWFIEIPVVNLSKMQILAGLGLAACSVLQERAVAAGGCRSAWTEYRKMPV